MSQLIDFVLHFDKYLLQVVQHYGTWVYGILFLIIFAETGLVVTPFLPGDSLLFAVGALSATGVLNPWLCYVLLIGAAILGDGVNYSVGRRIGPRLLGIGDVGGKYYVPQFGSFVIYTIMIVVLIWRPQGLFSRAIAK